MFVLPQILILGGKILEKTSFSMPKVAARTHRGSGLVAVDGLIVGEIRGSVNGVFRGTIEGDADLRLLSGRMDTPDSKAPEPKAAPAAGVADSAVEGGGKEVGANV
jgi:hypothetical protein